MSKKDNKYKSLDALNIVQDIINEAAEAVKDPKRTIVESAIPEALGAAGMGVAGAVVAGGLIYGLGPVGVSAAGIAGGLKTLGLGIGMTTGIGVAAAIVAVPAVGGYAFISNTKNKKLYQEKERLYKEALKKHDALINELKESEGDNSKRVDYLVKLNILLQNVIENLQADLGIE